MTTENQILAYIRLRNKGIPGREYFRKVTGYSVLAGKDTLELYNPKNRLIETLPLDQIRKAVTSGR